jgi:hypothetical protein
VQCDGTATLSFIERAGGKRPGCMSHGRRKFVEAALLGDKVALEALHLVAPLFVVERQATDAGDTADERLARRQEHSKPVIENIRVWLDEKRPFFPPKTALGKAIGYMTRQWHRLILFLDDGNIELTNNRRYAARGITVTMPPPGLCRVGTAQDLRARTVAFTDAA